MHIQTEICRIARPAYVRAGAAPRLLVKDSCPGGTRDGKTPPDRRCRPDQENVSTTIPQVQRSDVVDRVRTAIELRCYVEFHIMPPGTGGRTSRPAWTS